MGEERPQTRTVTRYCAQAGNQSDSETPITNHFRQTAVCDIRPLQLLAARTAAVLECAGNNWLADADHNVDTTN